MYELIKLIVHESEYCFILDEIKSNTVNIEIFCDKDSSVVLKLFITNTVTINLKVFLRGSGSLAKVFGACVLNDNSKVIINVDQIHLTHNTESHVIIKSVLDGISSLNYNGRIFVDQQATFTNATQENKNILLSDLAKVVSVPSLEVLTDNVKCKHGTATGYFDSEQLFYLMSRGLSLDLSKKLILDSFLKDIVTG